MANDNPVCYQIQTRLWAGGEVHHHKLVLIFYIFCLFWREYTKRKKEKEEQTEEEQAVEKARRCQRCTETKTKEIERQRQIQMKETVRKPDKTQADKGMSRCYHHIWTEKQNQVHANHSICFGVNSFLFTKTLIPR